MSTKEKKVLSFSILSMHLFSKKKNQLDLFTVQSSTSTKTLEQLWYKSKQKCLFCDAYGMLNLIEFKCNDFHCLFQTEKLNLKIQNLARKSGQLLIWFISVRIFFLFEIISSSESENSVRGCSLLEGRTCRPSDDDWVAFSNFYSSNSKTLPLEKNIFL